MTIEKLHQLLDAYSNHLYEMSKIRAESGDTVGEHDYITRMVEIMTIDNVICDETAFNRFYEIFVKAGDVN